MQRIISAKAFAPANISCIFKICNHKNPRWTGSCGLGFTVNQGVFVKAEFSDINSIFFNGKKINFPTVQYVIDELNKEYCKKGSMNKNKKIRKNKQRIDIKIKIDITSKLPLGCGFGLSGASALATAYALNKLLSLKKSRKELAILAHIAEVKNKTGLGDVINQYYGGFCLKLKPSSYFVVELLPIRNIDVYCRCFKELDTKSVITNPTLKKSINQSAKRALKKIRILIKNNKTKSNKKIEFGDIVKISKHFAAESGLLKDMKTINAMNCIEKNNGNASMIMLGNSVFSDIPFTGSIRLKITSRGARLL